EPYGGAADGGAAGAEAGRQIGLLREAGAAHRRAHHGQVRRVGNRNGLAGDSGIEWTDNAEHERVGGERLEVAGSLRRIAGRVDGVVARDKLDGEAIHRGITVEVGLRAVEPG